MDFLKIPLSQKDYTMKENREQSFLLQTSLSLSYLLHNWMSKELFGETSKRRNNKQEEKRKLNSFTLSNFLIANGDNIRKGAYFKMFKKIR